MAKYKHILLPEMIWCNMVKKQLEFVKLVCKIGWLIPMQIEVTS